MQTARDDADQDRVRGPHNTVATEALLEEERSRADLLLDHERDAEDAVLIARPGALGDDVGAERDGAPERPRLDLDLLVDAALGLGDRTAPGDHDLASAHLDPDFSEKFLRFVIDEVILPRLVGQLMS